MGTPRVYLGAAILLVAAIATLGVKLALAPFHHVNTVEECRAAYAQARTLADTARVDFRPFDDNDNAVDTRCSATRAIRSISSADITQLR